MDQNGFVALILAAGEGHHACLSILLANGAEANRAKVASVRGECSIACLRDISSVGVAAEEMRCNQGCVVTYFAAAVNFSLASQLS